MSKTLVFFAFAFIALFSSASFPADFYWINPSGGDMSDLNNWDPQALPGPDDYVFFNLPGPLDVFLSDYTVHDRLIIDNSTVVLNANVFEYVLDSTNDYNRSAIIGQSGQGSFTLARGIVNSHDVVIGMDPGSSGTLTVTGQATAWSAFHDEQWYGAFIGFSSNASLIVDHNALFRHGHGTSASDPAASAQINVKGYDSEWYVDGYFAMSDYGSTVLNMSDGAHCRFGKLEMALKPNSRAVINLNGPDHETDFVCEAVEENSLCIGLGGCAKIIANSSKIFNAGTMTIAEQPGSLGQLIIRDGSWVDCLHSVAVGGSLTQPGGTGRIDIIDSNLSDQTGVEFTPTSLQGEHLTIWPGGILNMSGGVIEMEYDSNQANPILVSGTLSGHGMIWADVQNLGGTVAPGCENRDCSILEIGYNYSQDPRGTLKIQIAGPEYGTDYGTLKLTRIGFGNVSLDGMLDIDLIDGYVPSSSDVFTIIQARNVSGGFVNAQAVHFFEAGTFDVYYDDDQVVLTNFRPEPRCSSYSLADFDRDCRVTLSDFAVFASQWLQCNLVPQYTCMPL